MLPEDGFAFFGYPSRPEVSREALAKAAERIRASGALEAITWEELDISGRLIIGRITAAIDRAAVSVFDVTTMNENVMFEVGYAIGAETHLWLVRDPSDTRSEHRWREVGVLRPVGFTAYENSHDLANNFLAQRPDERASTFFAESIEPYLEPVTEPSIFYLKGPIYTEADREIGRRIERERRAGIARTIADPRESAVESLNWYAYHCYKASAVVAHLMHPGRRGADVHNARCALVAGLGHGMKRPVLMLAEEGYPAPIDYQDLLYSYRNAQDAKARISWWLNRQMQGAYAQAEARALEAQKRSLSTELAGLRLGEHVAENEAKRLSRYFVSTAHFREVLAPRTAVFVGRKGTGKTANLIRAAEELEGDRRNLVCVIQPADYDLQGLVRLLRETGQQDTKSYIIEALWKYLLVSELALAALSEAKDRPAPLAPGMPAWELESFIQESGPAMSGDFAVRLEQAVATVVVGAREGNIQQQRRHISEALHSGLLHDLSRLLVPVLEEKQRVAILVDNLDQSWDTEGELEVLAPLLLGLLTTTRKIASDLTKRVTGHVDITLGVFIRSDIYFRVVSAAREPDKIPAQFLTWPDADLLLQVVEERYIAGRGGSGMGEQLWQRYFDQMTRGVSTRDYMAERVLPRPRDILYLANAAIEGAVRRRRDKVTESDVLEAERQYSQFAFDALLVEGADVTDLDEILLEFAGLGEILTTSEIGEAIRRATVADPNRVGDVINQLVAVSFLGRETGEGQFEFAENPRDQRRLDALARAYAASRGSDPRYRIHPAYQAYLDIAASDDIRQESLRV
jgi:hypothetical protein